VDHDADAARPAGLGDLAELRDEGLRVARPGRLHALSREDRERELGEVVAGEHVEGTALHHLARRLDAVAEEGAAVPDAKHFARARARLSSCAEAGARARPPGSAPSPSRWGPYE